MGSKGLAARFSEVPVDRFVVVKNESAAQELCWLTFDRAPSGHTVPGQFVTVAFGDQKSFFALASSPGEPAELLVKQGPGLANILAESPVGESFLVSPAIGNGFGADTTRPAPLVLLVNGSALAAVRSVVRAELAAGLPRPVTLLYGVLSLDRVPWPNELAAWEQAGIACHIVLDHPAPGWQGRTGYIQDHLADLGLLRPDVAAVLCGVPDMQKRATTMLREVGVPESRILVNY
jgi:NAD(P)H-flavin reductase